MWLLHNLSIISEFIQRKATIDFEIIQAEIRSRYLWNSSQGRYRLRQVGLEMDRVLPVHKLCLNV
jgi:hypothetical protein